MRLVRSGRSRNRGVFAGMSLKSTDSMEITTGEEARAANLPSAGQPVPAMPAAHLAAKQPPSNDHGSLSYRVDSRGKASKGSSLHESLDIRPVHS
jgi:hypothetical protein